MQHIQALEKNLFGIERVNYCCMWLTALTVNLVATGVGVAAFPRLGLLSCFVYEYYHWGSLPAARLRECKNAERLASTDPIG